MRRRHSIFVGRGRRRSSRALSVDSAPLQKPFFKKPGIGVSLSGLHLFGGAVPFKPSYGATMSWAAPSILQHLPATQNMSAGWPSTWRQTHRLLML